eukprot:CAMPEP_0171120252 /NCGR_PEP_ID=MMETSP0766_2-20121228/99215_1 /TAXON_ID=439317 /ORGANISM="Gambierdiscus australes, Strain CAWD 149" /LENGTH=560 /DNA_ID=CAMNT_0011582967 /DNA_START=44 /DNA_END=1726 /DNA_ORIENTATION=+
MEEGLKQEPLGSNSKIQSYGSFAPPSSAGVPLVCWFILVVELCERLSFYTFTGSQAFFLEHIGYTLATAGKLNAMMWTFCTVLTVLASWTADVVLGRYNAILAAGLVYFLATAAAAIAAWPSIENSGLYFVGVMVLLPLGTAGIKANISNFGADQYDPSDPGHAAAQERFFSVFYLSINVGAGLSYGFFTTFASSGGIGVPKQYGYFSAYLLMTFCMLGATAAFRMGRSVYRVHPLLENSALASVAHALVAAARRGCVRAAAVCVGAWLLLATVVLSTFQALFPDSGQRVLIAAFVTAGVGTLAVVVPCLEVSWLVAQNEEQSERLQQVRGFLQVLPVLFTGNLAFSSLYNCMQFWYQLQACQMDLRAFGGRFQLSGSFFNIADCLAIVIFTPLLVDWLNPLMERTTGIKLRHGLKFGTGMLIAGASVLIAARLEQVRRGASVLPVESNCAPPGTTMSGLNAAWMMVPFFLMGIGEIYTQPTLLHFAYAKSPASMRTLAMAASFFIQGVSSALFAVLVQIMQRFIPNDLNNGHLEYGYFANIIVGIVFYVFFSGVLSVAP